MYIHHCGAFPDFLAGSCQLTPSDSDSRKAFPIIPLDGWFSHVKPFLCFQNPTSWSFLHICSRWMKNSPSNPSTRIFQDPFNRIVPGHIYIYILNYINTHNISYFQTNTSITSTTPSPSVSHWPWLRGSLARLWERWAESSVLGLFGSGDRTGVVDGSGDGCWRCPVTSVIVIPQ